MIILCSPYLDMNMNYIRPIRQMGTDSVTLWGDSFATFEAIKYDSIVILKYQRLDCFHLQSDTYSPRYRTCFPTDTENLDNEFGS